MTILNKTTGWSRCRRMWSTLGAVLTLLGAAWLFAVQSGSDQSNCLEFKYRPIANAIHATIKRNPAEKSRHPLDDAFEFVQPSIQALQKVNDYSAVFTKTELVHGRLLTQKMDMKFREKPFSVYFHGHSKRKAGREVIFVAGRNDNRLIVHEVGLKSIVGTMNLTTDDPKVMDTNRHPITDVGMANIINSALDIWKNEKKTLDPANIEVRIVPSVQVGEKDCEVVEIDHHRPQAGLTYKVGRVYVEKETRLPVQAELYGWPEAPGDEPPLLEQYIYTNVKTNIGLVDADFDPQNREYRFAVSLRDEPLPTNR
jgi:hypothetical protein